MRSLQQRSRNAILQVDFFDFRHSQDEEKQTMKPGKATELGAGRQISRRHDESGVRMAPTAKRCYSILHSSAADVPLKTGDEGKTIVQPFGMEPATKFGTQKKSTLFHVETLTECPDYPGYPSI